MKPILKLRKRGKPEQSYEKTLVPLIPRLHKHQIHLTAYDC